MLLMNVRADDRSNVAALVVSIACGFGTSKGLLPNDFDRREGD
jgi:hypothetical protein